MIARARPALTVGRGPFKLTPTTTSRRRRRRVTETASAHWMFGPPTATLWSEWTTAPRILRSSTHGLLTFSTHPGVRISFPDERISAASMATASYLPTWSEDTCGMRPCVLEKLCATTVFTPTTPTISFRHPCLFPSLALRTKTGSLRDHRCAQRYVTTTTFITEAST